MATNNEKIVRDAYQVAEVKDLPGWIACFIADGTFTNESVGVTYRGKELSWPVENYARAFPDMHTELFRLFVSGDTVIVELALQGTHKGRWRYPLEAFPLRAREWMRRVSLERRQNSVVQLLSLRHSNHGPARRATKPGGRSYPLASALPPAAQSIWYRRFPRGRCRQKSSQVFRKVSRTNWIHDVDMPGQSGKTFIVTGVNSGVGFRRGL